MIKFGSIVHFPFGDGEVTAICLGASSVTTDRDVLRTDEGSHWGAGWTLVVGLSRTGHPVLNGEAGPTYHEVGKTATIAPSTVSNPDYELKVLL